MSHRPIGIVLSTAPERGDQHLALRVARAAASQERDLEVFAMGPGVLALGAVCDELLELGARLFACATSNEEYGAELDFTQIEESSQDDHAALVERCRPLLSLS